MTMQNILIGIDGGGTKTKLVATDEEYKILVEETGDASNHLSIGLDNAVKNLSQLIESAINKIRRPSLNYYITIGTAGAGRKDDVDLLTGSLKQSLRNKNIPYKKIKVVSDAEIAIEGALENEPGVLLICGTGSIVFGKDEKGNIHRVGGFGKLIGDEGSGYSIGRQGINLISKMTDERLPKTKLYNLFSEKFNINSGTELINNVYKHNFDISSVAPLVIQSAEEDEYCKTILDNEIAEVIIQLKAIKKKIRLEKFNLVLVGSLIKENNYYSLLLKDKIHKKFPGINIITPKHTPEYGALILSHKMLRNKEE